MSTWSFHTGGDDPGDVNEPETETETAPKKQKSMPLWLLGTIFLFLLPAGLLFVLWLLGLLFAHFGWFTTAGSAHLWTRALIYGLVNRQFFPNGLNILHASGWFWVLFGSWMALVAIMTRRTQVKPKWADELKQGKKTHIREPHAEIKPLPVRNMTSRFRRIVARVSVACLLLSPAMLVYSTRNNAMAMGAHYDNNLIFSIPTTGVVPPELTDLIKDDGVEKAQDGGACAYYRTGDVHACVTLGDMPDTWVRRVGSADAAIKRFTSASGGASNTNLLNDTLTYIYEDGGMWTAIRDGVNARSLDRIEKWNGDNNPTACTFGPQPAPSKADYSIKGSFGGSWSINLRSTIVSKFPNLYWFDKDVWGYCNGDEPVVVIPVVKNHGYGNVAMMEPQGVLTVRGDHGKTNIKLYENPTYGNDINRGAFPGPTYSMTLTSGALKASSWSGGRKLHHRDGFGFEAMKDTAQKDNNDNYLMKNATTGELDWMTLLVTRNSGTGMLVGIAVTPAGYINKGKLNSTTIFNLASNDPRRVAIVTMKAAIVDEMSRQYPGYFNSGGEIVEYLPVSKTHWQAYGERLGSVVFRFEIPIDKQVRPTLVPLKANTNTELPGALTGSDAGPDPNGTSNAVCAKPAAQQSHDELVACGNAVIGELGKGKK